MLKDEFEEENMVLEFKVPRNKLPFLGVRFASSYFAAKTYNEMVDDHKKEILHITLEITNQAVTLKVTCDGPPLKVWKYYDVKCDLKKLQLFLAIRADAYNFAHIYRNRYDKDEVVKTVPLNNLFCARISHISIIGDEWLYRRD